MTQFSHALEKLPFKAEVAFPSVYILQFTPSSTEDAVKDPSDVDSSDDEFFDALSNPDVDLEWLAVEDHQDLSATETNWAQGDWTQDDQTKQDWDQEDCTQNIRVNSDWIDDFWEQEDADNDTDETNTSETAPEHPLAGLHSPRLAKSDWTSHSFIDKADHIDIWWRHTECSLPQCTWCVFPEDCGWPKPETDPLAPELRLTTPEGEDCWLDDSVDYESLSWEKELAKVRNGILNAIS